MFICLICMSTLAGSVLERYPRKMASLLREKQLESTILDATISKTSKVESSSDGFVTAWQMDETGVCNYGLLIQNAFTKRYTKRVNGYYIHTGSMNGLPKFNHVGRPYFLLWCNVKAGWRISDLRDLYGQEYLDKLLLDENSNKDLMRYIAIGNLTIVYKCNFNFNFNYRASKMMFDCLPISDNNSAKWESLSIHFDPRQESLPNIQLFDYNLHDIIINGFYHFYQGNVHKNNNNINININDQSNLSEIESGISEIESDIDPKQENSRKTNTDKQTNNNNNNNNVKKKRKKTIKSYKKLKKANIKIVLLPLEITQITSKYGVTRHIGEICQRCKTLVNESAITSSQIYCLDKQQCQNNQDKRNGKTSSALSNDQEEIQDAYDGEIY